MAVKKKTKKRAETAHDDREINAWGIARFAIGVLVLVGVAMGAMFVLDRCVTRSEEAKYPKPSPMATERPVEPPAPKLQRLPVGGLAALRAEEHEQLSTYKWIDRQAGTVQIPIERAIELMARRGDVPARRQGPPVENPHSEPTDSSLGIKKKKEPRP